MTFKKDYINYLLYSVVNSPGSEFYENYRLRKIVDSIIAIDDVMKVTYLAGKTAGLEVLFKYLLYISDKIDKTQVTVFNLKDNFEYDKLNISKICANINLYKSENVQEVIKNITSEPEEEITAQTGDEVNTEVTEDEQANISNLVEMEDIQAHAEESETEDSGLTLIENADTYTGEAEVFELESISESVENSDKETDDSEEKPVLKSEGESSIESDDTEDEENSEALIENEQNSLNVYDEEKQTDAFAGDENDFKDSEVTEVTDKTNETDYTEESVIEEKDGQITTELPDIVIEVRKPMGSAKDDEYVKEETITNEAYYKFETKFFEEVKILEMLLATVSKECIINIAGKQTEKCLQCLTEIMGITSELSNLSRQLSFDLIADIFLTMNMYFTKSISHPEILTAERIRLLDSSLALVNSLIKGEDYLNYDSVVDKMEKLKKDITPEAVPEIKQESTGNISTPEDQEEKGDYSENQDKKAVPGDAAMPETVTGQPSLKKSQIDSANFKLKYLIKEFEKSFTAINNLKGEYSKFEALEKISELNNALRLIAKISAAIKDSDLLKLAEVTYVFLKYVKDYRMDMQEPEIQQIIKYIIFTFKMLLTNRKPEDFNVLVRHLNNPVKIFADS